MAAHQAPLSLGFSRQGASDLEKKKKKKHTPANTGDIRDVGLIPESGRSPGGGHATHSSILA